MQNPLEELFKLGFFPELLSALVEIIVCPKCGEAFKKPRFELNRLGFGFGLASLDGAGDYACPKCGYKGRGDEFAPPEPG